MNFNVVEKAMNLKAHFSWCCSLWIFNGVTELMAHEKPILFCNRWILIVMKNKYVLMVFSLPVKVCLAYFLGANKNMHIMEIRVKFKDCSVKETQISGGLKSYD